MGRNKVCKECKRDNSKGLDSIGLMEVGNSESQTEGM